MAITSCTASRDRATGPVYFSLAQAKPRSNDVTIDRLGRSVSCDLIRSTRVPGAAAAAAAATAAAADAAATAAAAASATAAAAAAAAPCCGTP
jgi:hypothetical protein